MAIESIFLLMAWTGLVLLNDYLSAIKAMFVGEIGFILM